MILNANKTGRGWDALTELQQLLQETYITKSKISERLQVTQPTLMKLLKDEKNITFKQLQTISKDSNTSLLELISLL
tara:strand:- start:3054 stop:3284 length:231 start_codon:yes stop_codon:yes gene_type:complete